MKKIIGLLAVCSLAITSCDMNKLPRSGAEAGTYFNTFQSYKMVREGIYAHYRGLTTGMSRIIPEIQANTFNAKYGYSNIWASEHHWNIQENYGPASALWSAYYSTIADANFFLDRGYKHYLEETAANNGLSNFNEEQTSDIHEFAGEAYFTRAFANYQLAQFFCAAYDEAKSNDPHSGIPLVKSFAPTHDQKKYPSRSTLKET